MNAPLLEVTNLKKHFPLRGGFFGGVTGHVFAVASLPVGVGSATAAMASGWPLRWSAITIPVTAAVAATADAAAMPMRRRRVRRRLEGRW